MFVENKYQHILLNDDSVPVIAETNMKVIELVSSHLAYGWSAEELHFQFSDLTLGQIYLALAYYWDNKSVLEMDIEKRLESVEKVWQTIGETPLEKRLKAKI